jgi:hypothetical protein
MGHRYLIAITVAVAFVALPTIVGCGGDDDDSTNASNDQAMIVKADFIQAANTACQERGKEMKAGAQGLIAEAESGSPKAAREKLIKTVIAPGFEGEVDDLKALEPPPGDEEEVEEIITAIQELVDRMRSDLAEGRNYPYRKTENIAAAYGLPACGTP